MTTKLYIILIAISLTQPLFREQIKNKHIQKGHPTDMWKLYNWR